MSIINFRGDARRALEFYYSVFGGQLMIATYGQFGVPQDDPDGGPVTFGPVAADSPDADRVAFGVVAGDNPDGRQPHTPGSAQPAARLYRQPVPATLTATPRPQRRPGNSGSCTP